MRIVFSPRALLRLREIQAYIAYDNVTAAARVVSRIRQSTEMLADFPLLGPAWDAHSRALVVSGLPYRIHYQVNGNADAVEIITVVHMRQKPPRFE
ncbi:MAG: type II toxin-antitoxin system RelE/ParE family toxin [Alphaproteobacteria bacterium]|nr:type II toxin-antitoxin system RelE/ParE family toxin [Alphaproteobacteria bacterium]